MAAIRFDTKEKASVEIYGKAGKLFAALKNLSRTGACLEYALEELPVKRGDLVRLTIDLPNVKRRHYVSAQVMWRNGRRTGLHFLTAEQLLEKMVGQDL